jgi:hypothetical protein
MKSNSTKKGLDKSSNSIDWAAHLNPQQRSLIKEGLADIKAGRTISSEKFWVKYNR